MIKVILADNRGRVFERWGCVGVCVGMLGVCGGVLACVRVCVGGVCVGGVGRVYVWGCVRGVRPCIQSEDQNQFFTFKVRTF